ncbi:hypothetical protein EVAR_59597_1 [Eumeta japonica]|uniref:Uncharacterized protein n=1 Tax=Eumeta variegata TaxID=151549 RepID=A0A4C1Z7U6_EUMVA|nr:hypothetical protein EVAR_59597_1 [Eumeta japonica]
MGIPLPPPPLEMVPALWPNFVAVAEVEIVERIPGEEMWSPWGSQSYAAQPLIPISFSRIRRCRNWSLAPGNTDSRGSCSSYGCYQHPRPARSAA